MPQPESSKARIPESLILGGVTYAVKDHPELREFISSVAQVEKQKLYSTFESMREQIKELSAVVVTEKPSAPLDFKEQLQQMKTEIMSELVPELRSVIAEVVQPVLQHTAEAQKETLASYRDKLIQDNIAVCIPDLVKGDSKEALDASLAESIRLRAAYPSANGLYQTPPPQGPIVDPLIQKQMKELELQQQAPEPTLPSNPSKPRVPSIPKFESPDGSHQAPIKAMTMEEFAAQRENLLGTLEAEFGGSNLGLGK